MTSTLATCRHPQCSYPAVSRPILVVEPKTHGSKYQGDPSRARLGFVVCAMHQLITQVSDLVDDKTWNRIVDLHRRAGRADPDRRTLRVEWEALTIADRLLLN